MKTILKYLLPSFTLIILITSCDNSNNQDQEEILPYSEVKKIHRDELLEYNRNLTQTDKVIIEKFIERRNWDMEITGTGLYYMIYQSGKGQKAVNGKYAEFEYEISLLDGTLLYSSEIEGNRVMLLGHNNQESGLDEGLKLMREGDKARFILHPFIAFGVPGDGDRIPVQAILLYDVKLVELRGEI